MFSRIAEAATRECEIRMDLAATELQRAADSKGIRYVKTLGKDLGQALEEISQDRCADVAAISKQALSAIPNVHQRSVGSNHPFRLQQ